MEEDIISDLAVFNTNRYIKTYSKTNKLLSNLKENDTSMNNSTIPVIKKEPLTTKNAMKFLLEGTLKEKVCRYCLNVTSGLSELDQILQLPNQGSLYKVTIRDMVASFHPIKVDDDTEFPNKICNKCLDRTISSYLFTQQCERAERALRNCFEDMSEKLHKLDPIERPKKRGRHKLNPNYNTLYTEHEKVINYAEPLINLIHTASESLTVEGHIKDFECPKCCQVLPDVESLLNHEKSHPKSMWYHCRLCGKSFPKRYQWKKHANTHLVDKPVKPAINNFTCNRCGEVSKDCNEYLRHIEKHKFKVIMEHLVEKRMDDLCSVCLDKSSKMTNLDKMVCLHGGHSDMAGDRSLYSVLASTIPDPKLYKYQELVLPHKSKIITIVKKDRNVVTQLIKPSYDLSHPIILTTDDINPEDLYIFFFSLPLTKDSVPEDYEPKEPVTICDLPMIESHLDGFKDVIDGTTEKNGKDAVILQKEAKIVFNFSKPLYIHEIFDKKVPIDEVIQDFVEEDHATYDIKRKPCKTCWIFNTNLCDECQGVKQQDIPKVCSYCWLFKHVDKCDYCKQPNKAVTEVKNVDTMVNTCSKEADCPELIKEVEDKQWQCTICLTTNSAARQTCCCCESEKLNDLLKIKFGQYACLFNEKPDPPSIHLEANNTTIDCGRLVEIQSESIEKTSEAGSISPRTNVQEMDIEILDNASYVIYNHGLTNYQPHTIDHFSVPIHCYLPEAMDIEETGIQNTCPPLTVYSSSDELNQVVEPLQFNIGTSGSDGQVARKFKRAVRKTGRASHK